MTSESHSLLSEVGGRVQWRGELGAHVTQHWPRLTTSGPGARPDSPVVSMRDTVLGPTVLQGAHPTLINDCRSSRDQVRDEHIIQFHPPYHYIYEKRMSRVAGFGRSSVTMRA